MISRAKVHDKGPLFHEWVPGAKLRCGSRAVEDEQGFSQLTFRIGNSLASVSVRDQEMGVPLKRELEPSQSKAAGWRSIARHGFILTKNATGKSCGSCVVEFEKVFLKWGFGLGTAQPV